MGFAAAAATTLTLLSTAAAAQATFVFNGDWGGAGVIATHHPQNLCAMERIEPGDHAKVIVRTWSGDHVTTIGDSMDYDGTLMCAPRVDVWRHSTGPWEGGNWISLRCPAGERPIKGGVGYTTKRSSDALAQVGGGFGSGNDGYWHYRFHNHQSTTAWVQLWAVCIGRHYTTHHPG